MNAIYKLVADGHVRYIGKTEKSLARRLTAHVSEARRATENHAYRLNWLRSLGQSPTIELIEWTASENSVASERYWIALAKDYGCRLVNTTEGGDGALGYRHTREALKKMRAAKLGKKLGPHSVEHNEKIGAAQRGEKGNNFGKRRPRELNPNTGRKQTPETVAKRIAKTTGKKRTPEVCLKISLGSKGKPKSPAHVAALCIAQQLRWARRREANAA